MAAGVSDTLWTMDDLYDSVMERENEAQQRERYDRLIAKLAGGDPRCRELAMSTEPLNSPAMDRMHQGVELANAGRHAEALEAYLWCWDTGSENDPAFFGVRLSFLLMYAKSLAEEYPPCAQAFEERKTAIQSLIDAGEESPYVQMDLDALVRSGF